MTKEYCTSLTREGLLFYEMRIVAKLLLEGLDSDELLNRINRENLFQYPTEKMIPGMVRACLRRIAYLNDDSLLQVLASGSAEQAKQVCLYALMLESRLVRDFMITVIGEKYRVRDLTFGRIDVLTYLRQLQEQNADVATWRESTMDKIAQVLRHILVETGYLDEYKAGRLNSVWICSPVDRALRARGLEGMLCAFNCFT